MSREVFYNLLKRYLEGNCTDEEQKIVEQWYSMLEDEDLPDIKEAELADIDEKLWAFVRKEMDAMEVAERRRATLRRMWPVLAAAASFIGLLVAVVFFVNTRVEAPQFMAEADTIQVFNQVNSSEVPVTITLEDSSHVTLQPGAALSYPAHFETHNREVKLEGEAFFQVAKDSSRPFYVFSNDLVTRVVGTSFIVKAHKDATHSEVEVLTGKVVVAQQERKRTFYKKIFSGATHEVVLTPNYKAVYEEQTESLVVTLVDNPIPIQPEEGTQATVGFVFNNTPLRKVLQSIEKTYGIDVTATHQTIYQCTFTGDLVGQDLHTQMEFICQSIGATYAIEGTTVQVKGGNCQ